MIKKKLFLITLGVPNAVPLTKPVTFSKLVSELERLGLLKPSPSSGSAKKSAKESTLSAEHHSKVPHHFLKNSINKICFPLKVKDLILKDSKKNLTDDPIIYCGDDLAPPITVEEDPIGPLVRVDSTLAQQDTEVVSPAHEADRKALRLLGKEHSLCLDENRRLKAEAQSLQAKCLKLENALSSGNILFLGSSLSLRFISLLF